MARRKMDPSHSGARFAQFFEIHRNNLGNIAFCNPESSAAPCRIAMMY